LWRLLFNKDHKNPIDFFVFDEQAKIMVNEPSFTQLTYEAQDQNISRKTPSDHCPIRVDLQF